MPRARGPALARPLFCKWWCIHQAGAAHWTAGAPLLPSSRVPCSHVWACQDEGRRVANTVAVQDHLLPAPYVQLMQQHALDACPTSSYADVERTFEEDLGSTPTALFREFEKQPLASASLAQVHRAVTVAGETVAVKVQHRTLRESAAADMATIRCAASTGSRFALAFVLQSQLQHTSLSL